MFGERNGWIGYRLRELLTETEAAVLPIVDAVYRAGNGIQRVGVPVHVAGEAGATPRSITIKLEPTRAATGTTTGLVFFGMDVTEQIALRVRLQTAEARQKAIVEQLPSGLGVLVVDRVGRPVVMTGDVTALVSATVEADVPLAAQTPRYEMRWADTGLPMTETDSPSTRALAGEATVADVIGRASADGREYDLRVSARPIRGLDGEIAGAVLVFERATVR